MFMKNTHQSFLLNSVLGWNRRIVGKRVPERCAVSETCCTDVKYAALKGRVLLTFDHAVPTGF